MAKHVDTASTSISTVMTPNPTYDDDDDDDDDDDEMTTTDNFHLSLSEETMAIITTRKT